jgi:YVTN family beta-propeller protein
MSARALPALAAVLFAGLAAAPGLQAPAYEVWAADQNGNLIYVLDPAGKVLRTIDSSTLGNARRPHMLWGVPRDGYVYSANTVANSVTVLDRNDGSVKGVITSVGKSPHSAQPNPRRPDRIYVTNIGPRATDAEGRPDRGETITEITRSGRGASVRWEIARRLDLKGDPALADTTTFPSRRPVCVGFSPDGRSMLVTLFDGGLAVVDLDAWRVSKAWGLDQIAQYGCGFAESPDRRELYVTAGDMHASWLYVFDVSGREPQLVRTHNLSAAGQDAHGVSVDPRRRDLWIMHRVSSTATIHPLATIRSADHQYVKMAFVGKTPDLIALSPDGERAYVTLRGPKPAPTIPHATVGETPGVAILDVPNRRLLEIVKLGDQETGDFHGVFVPAANR